MCYAAGVSDENAIVRMIRGHRAAAARQRELLRVEGPRPEQAVAEAISASVALSAQGAWPGPRDPVAEREVQRVRSRWVRIAENARQARGR